MGNLSTGVHSKTDISFSQSWCVIGTITSYGNDTSAVLNTCYQNELIFWGRSSQNLQLCLNVSKFIHVSHNLNCLAILQFDFLESSDLFSELLSSHTRVWISLDLVLINNFGILRDSNSCVNVVASAHDNLDTSSVALLDGLFDRVTERILEAEDTNSS